MKHAYPPNGLTRMERTRIPEPPFRCGFQPEGQSYARYVNHISVCEDRDCDRRFRNHLLMQIYFVRKYAGENAIMPANAETMVDDPKGRRAISRALAAASSRNPQGADSTNLGTPEAGRFART